MRVMKVRAVFHTPRTRSSGMMLTSSSGSAAAPSPLSCSCVLAAAAAATWAWPEPSSPTEEEERDDLAWLCGDAPAFTFRGKTNVCQWDVVSLLMSASLFFIDNFFYWLRSAWGDWRNRNQVKIMCHTTNHISIKTQKFNPILLLHLLPTLFHSHKNLGSVQWLLPF